jgi:hypothetical protein
MAAKPVVSEIVGEVRTVVPQLPPLGKRLHTRCAGHFLLVKHLMDKGDGNRSFADR